MVVSGNLTVPFLVCKSPRPTGDCRSVMLWKRWSGSRISVLTFIVTIDATLSNISKLVGQTEREAGLGATEKAVACTQQLCEPFFADFDTPELPRLLKLSD